ncbi:hypothetical protein P9578_25895 [Brevibacillus choshinensis]|uniref:hypothetical protein n=1 Tax=Brevibacillus choshinensis TaxID=54911 RepID=UPI002E1ED38C|nr:hypothetical protein [Brevibacillus choshinensis]
MSASIEPLLHDLLNETIHLKLVLETKEVEPEEINSILDNRELIMNQITPMLPTLNEIQRNLLLQAEDVNSSLLPILIDQKQRISSKVLEIQQLKTASNSYHYANVTTEYGVFFDKKK